MHCAHCGLPSPEGEAYCCTGCEAVARAIAGLSLGDYYTLRTRPANRPEAVARERLERFDAEAAQAQFVRVGEGGACEAELLIEGMTCAACAWLVEGALARVPGVESAVVGFANRKARVRWDAARARPSDLLGAVAAVGCAACPYDAGRGAGVARDERRKLSRRLWIAGLGMMQVMMYAFPAYVAGEGEIAPGIEALMRWAGLLLTLPVVAYSASPFFRGAWRDLRAGHPGMDVPIALGIAVAFTASAWATLSGSGAVYFDSIAMFVFLLLGARYLELLARARAARELAHLERLEPAVAERLRAGGGHATDTVAVGALVPGDRVLVRQGETVPADGVLEGPQATLNEAWLTGESRPVARAPGGAVLGGAINAGAAIVVRVAGAGDSALGSIRRMMERALEERPRWIAAAERASRWFVLAVLAAALLALVVWWPSGPAHAISIAVAVLVVTCPCALALAAPVTLGAASAALARRRLVVTRGRALERLAAATDIVFDKTGTLTEGRPRLLQVRPLGARDPMGCRALAAALARASAHPLDRALAAEAVDGPVPQALGHRAFAGEGVEARIDGRRVRLGRAGFAAALHGQPVPATEGAMTLAWLADEDGWIAVLRFGDALRPEAPAAVERLRRLGLRTHLLSGDDGHEARRVARELGIAACEGDATPARKLDYVRALQASGARVAMVGDGINDAPVLGLADVSVAMGGGADLAQVRADAVLLSDSLADLAEGVAIARRARRVLRQNLAWALGYNAIVVPLAFIGMVTPLVAGAAMAASSLLVVGNASRLLGSPWTSSTS